MLDYFKERCLDILFFIQRAPGTLQCCYLQSYQKQSWLPSFWLSPHHPTQVLTQNFKINEYLKNESVCVLHIIVMHKIQQIREPASWNLWIIDEEQTSKKNIRLQNKNRTEIRKLQGKCIESSVFKTGLSKHGV